MPLKISQMEPAVSGLNGLELVPLVQAGGNIQTNILNFIGAGVGAAPPPAALSDTDYLLLVQANSARKITIPELRGMFMPRTQSFTGAGPYTITLSTLNALAWIVINHAVYGPEMFTVGGQVIFNLTVPFIPADATVTVYYT